MELVHDQRRSRHARHERSTPLLLGPDGRDSLQRERCCRRDGCAASIDLTQEFSRSHTPADIYFRSTLELGFKAAALAERRRTAGKRSEALPSVPVHGKAYCFKIDCGCAGSLSGIARWRKPGRPADQPCDCRARVIGSRNDCRDRAIRNRSVRWQTDRAYSAESSRKVP